MFKRKSISSIVLIVFVCFMFSACGTKNVNVAKNETKAVGYPMQVVDFYGKTVTIEKEPKRIITVAPYITEIIYALGKGENLVGRSDYDDYPKEVSNVASVGELLKPSIEKIVELRPDIVIGNSLFDKDVIKKLEDLDIKVIVIYGEESFTGVYDTISKVGQVVNASEKAQSIISDMKTKVTNVTDKIKNTNKPTVYYVAGFGKSGDFTAGKDTFIGNMIEMAGGKNAADDVTGWEYSVEKLVEKNPDILLCSKLYDSKKGIEATNGYKDLKAVNSGNLFEVDENIVTRQGPRLADGLETIAKLIHPELFK